MKQKTLKTKMIEDTEVLSLEESIQYHLENNMTVPPPDTHIEDMVRICVDAISAVNDHDLDRMIDLGEYIRVTRLPDREVVNYCPAWEIVRRFRLDRWLNPEWQ